MDKICFQCKNIISGLPCIDCLCRYGMPFDLVTITSYSDSQKFLANEHEATWHATENSE